MRTSLLAAIILLGGYLKAQESFTLKKAQDYGLEHNKKLANADLDLEKMDAQIWETKAIGLPQINAEGQFQNFLDIPTQVLPANAFNPMAPADELIGVQFGTDFNVTGGVTVSQLIFSGNYLVGLQAIKASRQIYTQLKSKSEIEVKMSVAEAFYTVLILKENRMNLDSSLQNMTEMYELTNKLVEEEVMLRTNSKQLELGVLQLNNAIQSIDYQILLSKNLLKFQMGYPMEQEIVLEGDLESLQSDVNQNINPENNVDYQLLQTQLNINELQLKNMKANYLPTLSAFFSHQQQALRNDFNFFDSDESWYPSTLWGLQLSIPIFSSGQRKAQVEQASIDVMKTENDIEQLKSGLQLQIAQAKINYALAIQKMDLSKRAQELASDVLKDTEVLYNEGVATSIDLTQAQSQLLTEQTNYTTALFDLVKAKIELEKLAQ